MDVGIKACLQHRRPSGQSWTARHPLASQNPCSKSVHIKEGISFSQLGSSEKEEEGHKSVAVSFIIDISGWELGDGRIVFFLYLTWLKAVQEALTASKRWSAATDFWAGKPSIIIKHYKWEQLIKLTFKHSAVDPKHGYNHS